LVSHLFVGQNPISDDVPFSFSHQGFLLHSRAKHFPVLFRERAHDVTHDLRGASHATEETLLLGLVKLPMAFLLHRIRSVGCQLDGPGMVLTPRPPGNDLQLMEVVLRPEIV
jgi:hypothetical protein